VGGHSVVGGNPPDKGKGPSKTAHNILYRDQRSLEACVLSSDGRGVSVCRTGSRGEWVRGGVKRNVCLFLGES